MSLYKQRDFAMQNFMTWIIFFVAAATAQTVSTNKNGITLNDGKYSGRSCAQYTYEPYVGSATIEVDKHKIIKVEFQIVDTLANEIFGSDYEKHFPDNELYRQQCRNDWKGIQHYQKELLEKQDIDAVDAVSGATWSYNIFKSSVKKALEKK
jgi:major membrane immunogen (membrane-anchored lipoprotein)